MYEIAALTELLKEEARRLGFNRVGVIAAAPGQRLVAYLDWLQRQYHGEMGYLARPDRIARRQDPALILPGIQSIVCVGLDYYTVTPPPEITADPARGRISNYAWQVDYHEVMTPRLEQLSRWLQMMSGRNAVQSRAYVDTGAILERDHGEQAGLGFTGKNTMLIDPRRGSWFFLGELLTTISLQPDEPKRMPGCGRCTRCLTACPTDAFPAPYQLDARRCISYLTIELKGWIPRDLRPLMGNWIYGCDVCQDVCPFNRFAPETVEPVFKPLGWDAAAPPLLELLTLDEARFQTRFAHSPIQRIKRGRFLRNVCVAVGNWGDAAAVPHLASLLTDPDPLVRGHAAWALGQIGGEVARDLLQGSAAAESDPHVQQEIHLAIHPANHQ